MGDSWYDRSVVVPRYMDRELVVRKQASLVTGTMNITHASGTRFVLSDASEGPPGRYTGLATSVVRRQKHNLVIENLEMLRCSNDSEHSIALASRGARSVGQDGGALSDILFRNALFMAADGEIKVSCTAEADGRYVVPRPRRRPIYICPRHPRCPKVDPQGGATL